MTLKEFNNVDIKIVPQDIYIKELEQELDKYEEVLYKIRETVTLRNQEMTALLYKELLVLLEKIND